MIVNRSAAKQFEQGFAVEPKKVNDDSYVNMYLHHDGYPSWRGVELANWVNYMQKDQGFTQFGMGYTQWKQEKFCKEQYLTT
jgi:hypothetical protein